MAIFADVSGAGCCVLVCYFVLLGMEMVLGQGHYIALVRNFPDHF